MNSTLYERLIEDIGEKRYNHSLRVAEEALKLARIYKCDLDKVKVAAILHDCGKVLDMEKLLNLDYLSDISQDNLNNIHLDLSHSLLGALLAERVYNINDDEILDAIRYHTTGRENMTCIDKIIYLADYIEPARSFEEVEDIRKLALVDLDKAVLKAMESTIKFLISKEKLIDIKTLEARNYLLNNIKFRR